MPEDIVYPTDLDSGQMDDIVVTKIEEPEKKEDQESQETEENAEETQETEEKSEKEEGSQEKEGEKSEEKETEKKEDSEEAKEEKPEKDEKADKWSEEDLKYLESKGWKDIEFNEKNAAIIKSNRKDNSAFRTCHPRILIIRPI